MFEKRVFFTFEGILLRRFCDFRGILFMLLLLVDKLYFEGNIYLSFLKLVML